MKGINLNVYSGLWGFIIYKSLEAVKNNGGALWTWSNGFHKSKKFLKRRDIPKLV